MPNVAIPLGNGNYKGHVALPEKWRNNNYVYGCTISKKNVVYKVPGSLFNANGSLKKCLQGKLRDGLLEPEVENYLISLGVEIRYLKGAQTQLEEYAASGWDFVA